MRTSETPLRQVAWGWTAWRRWSEMPAHERRSHSYLENFKLLLEDGAAEGVDTVCPLPPGVTKVQAVADYLAEMRKYIRQHLKCTAGITLHTDEMVWCLTLPAIWSDAAKARMREAAHRAGLTVQVESRSLLLTLEPEAAALAAVMPGGLPSLGNGSPSAAALVDGDVLLVLDCGGGTVDATLHCVRATGAAVRLEEAAVGRGALAGGAHVDAAAWRYIRELLGPDPWDAWKEAQPGELVKLKNKWELCKRSFGTNQFAITAAASPTSGRSLLGSAPGRVASGQQGGEMRIPLPQALIQKLGPGTLLALSTSSNDRGRISADGALVLPADIAAKRIFDPIVQAVTDLMVDAINDGRRLGSMCNKVLLAGGFARSPYLQSRVRSALPAGTSLLIPTDPGAAVVTGSVIFGGLPTAVTARCCRYSYGVGAARPWTHEDAIHAASFGCPKKIWHEEKNCYYAEDTFQQFVKHGEKIDVGQVVKHTFSPLRKSQDAVEFKLYATYNNSARYTAEHDMEKLANITLQLPAGWSRYLANAQDYGVEVEMRFGTTELSLVAFDTRTKNAVAANVVWNADIA